MKQPAKSFQLMPLKARRWLLTLFTYGPFIRAVSLALDRAVLAMEGGK